MSSTVNDKKSRVSIRAQRSFYRLFDREAREVQYYGTHRIAPRDTSNAEDLFFDEYDSYVEGSSLDYLDSSACLMGIVMSAEPPRRINYGQDAQIAPGSYHKSSFYVVFRLEDVLFDPDVDQSETIFDRQGGGQIGWAGDRYLIDSFSKEGFGSNDFMVKVLVHKLS